MKLKLITLAAIVFLSAAVNETRVVAAPSSVSAPLQVSASENNWIEIGTVTITGGYDFSGTLYAMYLGERILYRVYYNAVYYSVAPNPDYDNESKNWIYYKYNAQITVKGSRCYLSVPAW